MARPNPLEAFVWGAGGAQMTPEEIARQREVAAALTAKGVDTSPVGHWTQGLARVVDAIGGAVNRGQADRAEASNTTANNSILQSLLQGGTSGFPAAPASAFPAAPAASGGGQASGAADYGGDQLAWTDAKPYQKALLNTISGPESGGRYNVIYGGGKFDDFSHHPGKAVHIQTGPNAGRTSSAAGKYQFLGSTWDDQAKKLGLTDFSPANQDKAAWNLAAETYKAKTGQSLDDVLQSGDPNAIASVGKVLSPIWTSLPGGIEQGTNTNRFVATYQKALGAGATPAQAQQAAAQEQAPVQVASLDPSAGMAPAPTSLATMAPGTTAPAYDPSGLPPLDPNDPMAPAPQASPIPGAPPVNAPPAQAGPQGTPQGLVTPGNIDLAKRPVVKNADGTISTVRSMSFEEDGKEILIPTVSPDGKILSDQDAIKLYRQTGQHLGIFDNPDDATAYAQSLHESQAKFYGGGGDAPTVSMVQPAGDGQPPVAGTPAAASPAGQRVMQALINPQSMTGGAPMAMQGAAPASSGAPQGAGTPGEIRQGADGKNYQYAQTTGMAGATGDQGWIETSMAAPQGGQPAPDNLPVMAGGSADAIPAGQAQQGINPAIIEALSNPAASEQTRKIAGMLLGQQMQQNDPGNQLDMKYKQAQIDALGAKAPKEWVKLDDDTLFNAATGETKQIGAAGGPPKFAGTGLDAQAWNILQTADPSSREYATAYSIVSQPKTQLVQTENGMMPVEVPPNLPAWLQAPGGGPAASPGAAAAPPGATAAPSAAQAAPGAAAGVIPGTKKQPTESQSRNGAIGHILLNEVPTLGTNFKALSDPKGQFISLFGAAGNPWQSEEYQRAAGAVKSAVTNVLYSLSGASSNPGEVLNQIDILTPKYGDKPGALADKLQRFKTYVRSVSSEANDPELTKMVEDAISQMDAPAAGGDKKKTSTGVEWSVEP